MQKSLIFYGLRETMGRMRENPRYNVISMRISDQEQQFLEEVMQKSRKSASEIMRAALKYLMREQTLSRTSK
ncbi:hypothetical protein Gura_1587 [Geotalea uraniireducens Rf4]|uniref:Ribbon-helix-helix protein CopG domain-containing protein n=1 Tax=Geotalea uraniireducens (strain Rf4) TaxID=351605 RepID=A5GEC8_GEOUR|nr:hypothetical protein Gura_1587 [Geotalea uraniireducens Rf4]